MHEQISQDLDSVLLNLRSTSFARAALFLTARANAVMPMGPGSGDYLVVTRAERELVITARAQDDGAFTFVVGIQSSGTDVDNNRLHLKSFLIAESAIGRLSEEAARTIKKAGELPTHSARNGRRSLLEAGNAGSPEAIYGRTHRQSLLILDVH